MAMRTSVAATDRSTTAARHQRFCFMPDDDDDFERERAADGV
ncbi:hypothetical protein [Streptomyces angustmyceticus]